jgi:ATP-dependent protease ClpP protease subunit
MLWNKHIIERWNTKKALLKPEAILNVKNDSAELFLYDVIGADMFGGLSAKDFAAQMKDLKGVKNLDVRINSPGGDVFDGLAMYALLNNFKGTKTVYIDGLAASIASVIAMAGDKVVMAPEAELMIHSAWTVSQGNAKDLRKLADQLEQADTNIQAIYERKTGMDKPALDALMAEETWMSATKAVELKFADSVIEPPAKSSPHAQTTKVLNKLSPIEVLRLRAGLVGKP